MFWIDLESITSAEDAQSRVFRSSLRVGLGAVARVPKLSRAGFVRGAASALGGVSKQPAWALPAPASFQRCQRP
jgi:hypothetical protein